MEWQLGLTTDYAPGLSDSLKYQKKIEVLYFLDKELLGTS